MKTISMFVDLTIKENNNLPFDSHPSAVAHRQYAQILGPYLIKLLSQEPQKQSRMGMRRGAAADL